MTLTCPVSVVLGCESSFLGHKLCTFIKHPSNASANPYIYVLSQVNHKHFLPVFFQTVWCMKRLIINVVSFSSGLLDWVSISGISLHTAKILCMQCFLKTQACVFKNWASTYNFLWFCSTKSTKHIELYGLWRVSMTQTSNFTNFNIVWAKPCLRMPCYHMPSCIAIF